MESICTAEMAEDAEIALTWLSANSAVSAVHPASAPAIHWKKRSEIFHRKTAQFITAVVVYSQSPNQSPERNGGDCPAGEGRGEFSSLGCMAKDFSGRPAVAHL